MSPDEPGLSEALQAEVSGLQGGMSAAAERLAVPDRFDCVPIDSGVIITDTETGRSVHLGLCDYFGARKLLAALFGPA